MGSKNRGSLFSYWQRIQGFLLKRDASGKRTLNLDLTASKCGLKLKNRIWPVLLSLGGRGRESTCTLLFVNTSNLSMTLPLLEIPKSNEFHPHKEALRLSQRRSYLKTRVEQLMPHIFYIGIKTTAYTPRPFT